MGYRFEETSEGLTLFNVEIMSTLTRVDRPQMPFDIDVTWLNKAVTVFMERKQVLNRRPLAMRRHNVKGLPAEVVGRLDNLRVENNWIIGDVTVTNPLAIEKLKRGEFPTRSAEFDPERHLLWGLSLTEGQEGHFDDDLPELVLEELVHLGIVKTTQTFDKHTNLLLLDSKENLAMLSPEDISMIRTLIAEGIRSAFSGCANR